MAFVKLDTGILNSTLWFERDCREVFITALLMAHPIELREAAPQLHVDRLEPTGFSVPAGWYGFVPAAGPGIVRMAMCNMEAGTEALRRLGSPDPESRTPDHDGRRLVRVDGGYVVLNFIKYREKDATTRDRSARYRERQREIASRRDVEPSQRDDEPSRRDSHAVVTRNHQAEAEASISDVPNGTSSSPAATRKPIKAKTPDIPCPYEAILSAYHEALPSLPKAKLLPQKRKDAMRRLWAWVLSSSKSDGAKRANNGEEALAWIREYFGRANANDFLLGRTARSAEHAGWQCDIDFLLTDAGMKQVIEKTQDKAA